MVDLLSAPPPQNLDAEESVLGALMLSSNTFEAVEEVGLRPDEFYRHSHGAIYAAAVSMNERGEPVDAVTLVAELKKLGKLKDAGGEERVHEIAVLVPSHSNVAHYARLVRDAAACRALVKAGMKIAQIGHGEAGEVEQLIAEAEGELTKAVSTSSRTAAATPMSDGLAEIVGEIREAYKTGVPIFGTKTGFDPLDEMLSGLWPGQLVLIAARPGNGKSTLALNIAENYADRGDAVLFASLEMSKYELTIRSLARSAKINSRVLATGMITDDHAKRLGAAIKVVEERAGTLVVQDNGSITVPSMRAEARRLKRSHDLKLVVVDYLQLMQGAGEENRNQEIGTISRSLKLLARELEIPIIALSQMSRNIESRAEKRPMLSDLRDSGSLEQDADVVVFIHSDTDYNPTVEPDGTVELIVAKQRKGETGIVKLAYNRTYSSFGVIR